MRLYKPGLHTISSFSPLETPQQNCGSVSSRDADTGNFSISPYLLLPDSFGDIYIGDTLSAYIAVVNGLDLQFTNVTMELHLLSTNGSIELQDTRAGAGPNGGDNVELSKDGYTDKIISKTLTELGTHTLEVKVSYSVGRGVQETLSMAKSYRFNVLQPLEIATVTSKFGGDMAATQCVITNTSQSSLLLEDVTFSPSASTAAARSKTSVLKVESIANTGDGNYTALGSGLAGSAHSTSTTSSSSSSTIDLALLAPLQHYNLENTPVLQPGEQHAFGFVITRDMMIGTNNGSDSGYKSGSGAVGDFVKSMKAPLGAVEVTWCAHLGERGVLRSAPLRVAEKKVPPPRGAPAVPKPELDFVSCCYSTSNITVGSRFDLTIVCINHSSEKVKFRMVTNPSASTDDGSGLELELVVRILFYRYSFLSFLVCL
jgi:hypothetical protein